MREIAMLFGAVLAFVVLSFIGIGIIVVPTAHFFAHGQWYFGIAWVTFTLSAYVTALVAVAAYIATRRK